MGARPGQEKISRLNPEQGAQQRRNLQEVEDSCRLYSAYAWLSHRLPDYFPSVALAQQLARAASEQVDSILHAQNGAARKKHDKKVR